MRLLIVSNRLPITALDGSEPKFQESVGGLVSGLKAYLDFKSSQSNNSMGDYAWIGWLGATIEESMEESVKSKVYSEFHAYPVFPPESAMERFYHGFCNGTIWPAFSLFHIQRLLR